jgi:hypothetical protein
MRSFYLSSDVPPGGGIELLQAEKMEKWRGRRKALSCPFVGRQIPEFGMAKAIASRSA